MNSHERELALRAHIRTLLLDYALTHLTRNYVAYTEHVVSEVGLSLHTFCSRATPIWLQVLGPALHKIPTNDATSLVLEPTLHEQIDSCLRLKCLAAYDEKWVADPQSLAALKKSVVSRVDPQRTPTMTCWRETDDSEFWEPSPVTATNK